MLTYDECFEKGLLKDTQKQPDLAIKDLKRAEFFLSEASELFELGKVVMGVIALYNAYFHCARSLLFSRGIKEKSHYCLRKFIEVEYVRSGKISSLTLDAFALIMNLRHTAQYSIEAVKITDDINELQEIAHKFIGEVHKLLLN